MSGSKSSLIDITMLIISYCNHRGNTIGLTCAVDRVSQIPYLQKPTVDESPSHNTLG